MPGNDRLEPGVTQLSIDNNKECAFMVYAGFELPPGSEGIKRSVLQKMTSFTQVWVDRQVILTSSALLVAKIGKNFASETIKLHLVEKVTIILKAMHSDATSQIECPGVVTQDMFAFQVFMMDAGAGDCSYSFGTTSKKECRKWEKAIETAVEAAKRHHVYAIHPENGLLARIALRCKHVYKSQYCKFFLSSVINLQYE